MKRAKKKLGIAGSWERPTLMTFGMKHYIFLVIALVVAICILVWRWRQLMKRNKSLEEELRLLQPFHNQPVLSAQRPSVAPAATPSVAPSSTAAPAYSPPVAPVAPDAVSAHTTPVVPDTVTIEDDDVPEEEEPTGMAPMLGAASSGHLAEQIVVDQIVVDQIVVDQTGQVAVHQVAVHQIDAAPDKDSVHQIGVAPVAHQMDAAPDHDASTDDTPDKKPETKARSGRPKGRQPKSRK